MGGKLAGFLFDSEPSTSLGIAGRPDQSSIVHGASFQFGRTSILLWRAPHLPHFTLDLTHGTGVSPGQLDRDGQRIAAGSHVTICGKTLISTMVKSATPTIGAADQ